MWKSLRAFGPLMIWKMKSESRTTSLFPTAPSPFGGLISIHLSRLKGSASLLMRPSGSWDLVDRDRIGDAAQRRGALGRGFEAARVEQPRGRVVLDHRPRRQNGARAREPLDARGDV